MMGSTSVFIPWERVFMCGEWEFGGRMALTFADFHRHSYCGCKPALTDIIMGATALVAEYNGVENAPHIRDEITEFRSLLLRGGYAAWRSGTSKRDGWMLTRPVGVILAKIE